MAWSSAELRSVDSCSWRYWVLSILGKRFLFPQTGGQRQINNYWQTLWLPSLNSMALFIIDGAHWRQPRLFIKRELLKYSSCTLPKTLVLSNVGAVDVLNGYWWLIARWFCCKACFCISGETWGMNEKLPLMVLCWHNYPIISHWGRVTHICIDKLTIIGSDNGLRPPGRRQVIIWTNAGILLIGPLGTIFSEILIGIQTFSFKKMHMKMSSAKWRPFVSASMS